MGERLLALIIVVAIPICPHAWADTCTTTPWSGIDGVPPLTDYPPGYLYLGKYPGFLYDGSNQPPSDHEADGLTLAAKIQPRDTSGAVCSPVAPGCKIVFLSIGFSNNTIEFCGGAGIGGDPDDPAATPCPLPTAATPYLQTESFISQALGDPGVNHTTAVLVDGAKGGETLADWDPNVSGYAQYDRVLNEILLPSSLSEAQVQSIWVKDAESRPTVSLATGGPGNPPDAIVAERHLGNIMRAIRTRYPNAQQVFISSRIYAGYANTANPPNGLNPEPYAYELGFSIKWLVDSQIQQIRRGAPDQNAGDLDYRTQAAPWIAWGPYLWANGTTPRSDGLVWEATDFRYPYETGSGVNECTHPSVHAEQKVASMLLQFMKTTPFTTWFLAPPGSCSLESASLQIAADTQTLSWSGGAPLGPFDVARGDIRLLHSSAGSFGSATCFRNNLTTTSTTDPAGPPPSAGAYYLVRCDGGTWNDGSQAGDRDATLTTCP
jgi:hypothetical protein